MEICRLLYTNSVEMVYQSKERGGVDYRSFLYNTTQTVIFYKVPLVTYALLGGCRQHRTRVGIVDGVVPSCTGLLMRDAVSSVVVPIEVGILFKFFSIRQLVCPLNSGGIYCRRGKYAGKVVLYIIDIICVKEPVCVPLRLSSTVLSLLSLKTMISEPSSSVCLVYDKE